MWIFFHSEWQELILAMCYVACKINSQLHVWDSVDLALQCFEKSFGEV